MAVLRGTISISRKNKRGSNNTSNGGGISIGGEFFGNGNSTPIGEVTLHSDRDGRLPWLREKNTSEPTTYRRISEPQQLHYYSPTAPWSFDRYQRLQPPPSGKPASPTLGLHTVPPHSWEIKKVVTRSTFPAGSSPSPTIRSSERLVVTRPVM